MTNVAVREETKVLKKDYDKTEDDLKALQSVGQIIGEVLRQLDADRFIVKASSGPRYVVGCRNKIDHSKLVQGTRVSLDMTTLTIMRHLPREVDPTVYAMQAGMFLQHPLHFTRAARGCAGVRSRTATCAPPGRAGSTRTQR